MFFFLILLINVTLIVTELNIDGEYCDINADTCGGLDSFNNEKYIFYDVNPPEGFNLRRDVYMRFAIMLTEAQKRGKRSNWRLVLPPFHNLYHWRSEQSKSKPMPWSAFFDVTSLKKYAPVMELHEVFDKSATKLLQIDRLYVLQNYKDPFEGGTFVDKWEMESTCEYFGSYWGNSNVTAKETICVKFQGRISKLWELVALHSSDERIMFAHGEIPLHDTYGTKPYWDCRKSMKFNKELVKRAKLYISRNLDCTSVHCNSYIAIHWRRSDFARSRKNDVPSIAGTAKQINAAIKKIVPKINIVFIATDASSTELNELVALLKELGYYTYSYLPSKSDLESFRDGQIAVIDQIICSHATHFIGTHESTFSFRIQEEREILGFNSNTTFNRLCPDTGSCEQPSKWTVVN